MYNAQQADLITSLQNELLVLQETKTVLDEKHAALKSAHCIQADMVVSLQEDVLMLQELNIVCVDEKVSRQNQAYSESNTLESDQNSLAQKDQVSLYFSFSVA